MIFISTDFAQIIKNQVGSDSEIIHKPPVEDDPKMRRPDISLAKKIINWEPRVGLEKGLQKTIEYFRKELGRSNLSGKDTHADLSDYQVP